MRPERPSARGWLAILLLLLPLLADATVVELSPGVASLPLGGVVEYFLDPAGGEDPEVAARSAAFRPMGRESLNLGFRPEVLWARVALRNPTAAALERWLEIEPGRLERVTLFVDEGAGVWRRLDNGVQVIPAERPVPGRQLLFPLRLEPGRTMHLLLRVKSRPALSLRPVLWAPEAQRANAQRELLMAVALFGVLAGVGLLILLLAVVHRDLAALYNFLGIPFFLLFELSFQGFAYSWLWPHHPEWALRAPTVFGMIELCCFALMSREFLMLRTLSPRLGRLLAALAAAALAVVAAHLLGAPFQPLNRFMALLGMAIFAAVAVTTLKVYWRDRFHPARLLVAGVFLVAPTGVLLLAEVKGWLPRLPFTNEVTATVLLTVTKLLSSLAIADRIALLRREREAAQGAERAGLEELVSTRTAELRAAKERAERADRAKGAFLARVSHELRTPLHAILGYAHLLRRDLGDGPREARLTRIEEGGRHLLGLIDDLLDYTRLERQRLTLRPEACYLHHLLARWREQGELLAARQGNRFEAVFSGELPPVLRLDARHLEQVVLILLANAARYTRDGSIVLRVGGAADTGTGGTRLALEVADSGVGIEAARLEEIFEPFRQAGEGAREGLGLGLAIGRQLARAMGGELWVESRPGAGSRFGFEAAFAAGEEAEVALALPDLPIIGYAGARRAVLIVEDHVASREFLQQLLEELGFAVQSCADLAEALVCVGEGRFDLALLDQRLPDGSGWELLATLRAAPATRDLPAILLSATPAEPPPGWGEGRGFDALLLKPVDVPRLLERVGELLGLEWQRASVNAGDLEPPEGEADPPTQTEGPANKAWAELAEYAHDGAVYEIEAWIERMRGTCRDDRTTGRRLAGIERRLEALDFSGIAALAESVSSPAYSSDGCSG
ncbi:hybrid sensor histidine kinase/response regulator [Endothiovibrio diazotrophicus]